MIKLAIISLATYIFELKSRRLRKSGHKLALKLIINANRSFQWNWTVLKKMIKLSQPK